MLTKLYRRVFVPRQPEIPAVDPTPERTVCAPSPPPGYWTTQCHRVELPSVQSGIQIPPGGELVVVYDPNGAIDPITGQTKVIDAYIRVCQSVFVPTGPSGPIVCTTYPAQPGSPAVPEVPERWEVQQVLSWDAGANSIQSHSGDCVCTFTMGAAVGTIIGFTNQLEEVEKYQRLSHALYFHGRRVQVMESGKVRTAEVEYAYGDEFKILRAGGVVTYLHNGEKLYVSAVPSSGEIHVGCAIYASGDSIE